MVKIKKDRSWRTGAQGEINKTTGRDRKISCVRQEKRKREVGLVMMCKELGHKQRTEAVGNGAK